MAIYIIRHGESKGNEAGFFQGNIDCDLTGTGRSQAEHTGKWLAPMGLAKPAFYSSPLRRAFDTAQIIASQLGVMKVAGRTELSEYRAGRLEGLLPEEIKEQFPEYDNRDLGKRGDFSAYGGESYEDMQIRLSSFIDYVYGAHGPSDDLVLVSHGGAIYQLLKLWCAWPVPRHFFTRIPNCCCIKLDLRDINNAMRAELQWVIPPEMQSRP